jgi:hypothetical protein
MPEVGNYHRIEPQVVDVAHQSQARLGGGTKVEVPDGDGLLPKICG